MNILVGELFDLSQHVFGPPGQGAIAHGKEIGRKTGHTLFATHVQRLLETGEDAADLKGGSVS